MGFYSVLTKGEQTRSLFENMIRLGKQYPLPANSKLPDNIELGLKRANQCVSNEDFSKYASDHPYDGMPLAVTGLTDTEYSKLTGWLVQGGVVSPLVAEVSRADRAYIDRWESWLNGKGARQQLVSRWLYEHLFLAHLYFEDNGADTYFFEMVRSHTPPGKDIDIIATRLPNDDPEGPLYYRLRPLKGSIIHKRHITFAFGQEQFQRTRELFEAGDWQAGLLPDYSQANQANPFATFAAIPTKARYQFMLDNAEYFVRTFIRGPVCRGQIATDVIRDQFWVFFQDPAHDQYITDAAYRRQATPLLAMPGQLDSLGELWGMWRAYRDKRNQYKELRRDRYGSVPADWAQIWRGNDNALLTVFRHHDSASVRKGLIGEIPQTLWWMDFPLLERTYYQLVVNFDVFGNVSHQAQTRLYFDLIRNGAEVNFLRLLPAGERQALLNSWYEKSGQLKLWLSYTGVDTNTPSGLALPERDALPAFAAELLRGFQAINA